MVGTIPGTEVHWGLVVRHRALHRALCPDDAHDVRLRGADDRRQLPRRARAGAAGRAADRRLLARSPAPAPGLPASSRWRRSRAAPTPRSPPATASPASSSRSWRGTIRSPSRRSRSCSAASSPSGGLIQRRMGLPDATVLVLQGLIFVVLLTSETLYGRFSIFKPRAANGPHMSDRLRHGPDRHARRRDPRLDALHVRRARRVPHREIGPGQSRARRHAGARRDGRPTRPPITPAIPGSACWPPASRARRSAPCTARSAGCRG